jgi:phosphatidylserine/phosphatidylglycerophosphate/cardiolipin synthase-like enzyme
MVATSSTKQTFSGHDQSLQLSDSMQLLIDAGIPSQSTIYDHAMALIDAAEQSIFFTCQYFPGGKTAQHLLAAHKRGVQVRIVFSHPHRHGKKAPLHHVYNTRERLRLPPEFFAYRQPKHANRLHAKVIATEKGAIVGSNNYVTQGVMLGTAEIALQYDSPAFAQQLIQKIESQF